MYILLKIIHLISIRIILSFLIFLTARFMQNIILPMLFIRVGNLISGFLNGCNFFNTSDL